VPNIEKQKIVPKYLDQVGLVSGSFISSARHFLFRTPLFSMFMISSDFGSLSYPQNFLLFVRHPSINLNELCIFVKRDRTNEFGLYVVSVS